MGKQKQYKILPTVDDGDELSLHDRDSMPLLLKHCDIDDEFAYNTTTSTASHSQDCKTPCSPSPLFKTIPENLDSPLDSTTEVNKVFGPLDSTKGLPKVDVLLNDGEGFSEGLLPSDDTQGIACAPTTRVTWSILDNCSPVYHDASQQLDLKEVHQGLLLDPASPPVPPQPPPLLYHASGSAPSPFRCARNRPNLPP